MQYMGTGIAGVVIDAATGLLTPVGHAPTEAVPSALALDPEGRILFAAGTAPDRLTSYRIDSETGALTPLANAVVGRSLAVGGVATR